MKRIREIESKPSDRVGSTQIEEVTRILEEYSEIESKPSDHRIGSTQIEQNDQMVLVRCVMAKDNCNSAEKRILKEFHEFESNPSDDFKCALLDWNIYEWQFALRGPSGTEFEGGIYHGRIKFPEEYPSKPPSFMFLTETGLFKTQRDICLSRFWKWRSSWTVRYALLALIDLMPTYQDDEMCLLECIKEGRRVLALKSRSAATIYGSSECQKVIDQIHQYMLSKAPNGTSGGSEPSQASNGTGGVSVAYNISQITVHSTDSHNVGIFGFMNEACIRGGGTLGPVLARTPIVKEYREIESNPSDDFKCGMLERNPIEWQFGIRGAFGTEFEGGVYHGHIQFPEEYPSKPPSFVLLTENGRFRTHTKITIRRLNDWQPSWRVRDALRALIDEMSTYPDGEFCSVECSKEERRDLAIKSRAAPPIYVPSEHQMLIDEINKYLLSKSPPVPQLPQLPQLSGGCRHLEYISLYQFQGVRSFR